MILFGIWNVQHNILHNIVLKWFQIQSSDPKSNTT